MLFCGTCSSNLFWDVPANEHGDDDGSTDKDSKSVSQPSGESRQYTVFTGALVNDIDLGHQHPTDQLLVELAEHIALEDTIDGGVSPIMRRPNGSANNSQAAKRWFGKRLLSKEIAEDDNDWPRIGTKHVHETSARWRNSEIQEIPLWCHCRGVDLVYRSEAAYRDHAAMELEKLPRFIDPISRKPVVGTDACNSCRTSFGTDFVHWTFSALRHIGFPQKQQEEGPSSDFPSTVADLYRAVTAPAPERDLRLGTLAVYRSSEGVKRYFCANCSASVFYTADKNQHIVDVAMGLLDSPDGARAEGSFLWCLGGSFIHRDDIKGTWRGTWLNSIEAESEAWRKERDFPEWWRMRR